MFSVIRKFPDATALRQAVPSELGIAVLQGIVQTHGPREQWTFQGPQYFLPQSNLIRDIVNGVDETAVGRVAAADAVAWLFSHDLISELYRSGSGDNPTIIPTPLGYEVAAAAENAPGAAAHAMRVLDLMPSDIRLRILQPLIAGDFDVAITNACKAVEVKMREKGGLSRSDFGARLARKFFAKVTSTKLQHIERHGDLSDEEHLFIGLFGLYRDRAVHEAPHVDSLVYALEILVTTVHLLRIVEAAELDAT